MEKSILFWIFLIVQCSGFMRPSPFTSLVQIHSKTKHNPIYFRNQYSSRLNSGKDVVLSKSSNTFSGTLSSMLVCLSSLISPTIIGGILSGGLHAVTGELLHSVHRRF